MATDPQAPLLLEQQTGPDGYVRVFLPSHPDARGGWVFLHRLVMEAALGGRLPPSAEVHHRDGNRSNNAFLNLQLLPRPVHRALHDAQDREAERTRLECDGWAADAFEILRLWFEDAREKVPFEWTSRPGAALLAAKAKRTDEGRALGVLEGRYDSQIRAAKERRQPPKVLAAELGVPESVIVQRFKMMFPGPVTRKAGV